MNKLLLLFYILIVVQTSIAQTKEENISICGIPILVKSEPQNDGGLKINFKNLKSMKDTNITLYSDKIDVIQKYFEATIVSLLKNEDNELHNKCDYISSINSYSTEYFYKSYITANLIDDAPVAGLFKIKENPKVMMQLSAHSTSKNKRVYTLTNNQSNEKKCKGLTDSQKAKYDCKITKVTKVKVEIANGFIQNLIAYVEIKSLNDNSTVSEQFKLPYPIGFTSLANFNTFKNIKLVHKFSDKFTKEKNLDPFDSFYNEDDSLVQLDEMYYISLSDLIDYQPNLGVERRDYSPEDTVFDLKVGESILLNKVKRSKLFEARIYSDLVGINEEKPNGLIQIDVEKKVNINTRPIPTKSCLKELYRCWGFLNYISPTISINKIEENNRRLITNNISSLPTGSFDSTTFNEIGNKYVKRLDLYRHQSFTGGFDLNAFYFINHQAKFEAYLNLGVRLSLTPITDSFVDGNGKGFNNFTVSTIQLRPEFKLRFLPEERFNLELTNKLIYGSIRNNQFNFVNESVDKPLQYFSTNKYWIYAPELLMSIFLNYRTGNKIYARLRYNRDLNNRFENFTQIQIGYSDYILR